MTSYENNYMDLDKMYNTDLKIKYLINNETYLSGEIAEALLSVQSTIDAKYNSNLIDISEDISKNMNTLLKNENEYEQYIYKKYADYCTAAKASENRLDSILNDGGLYGIYRDK